MEKFYITTAIDYVNGPPHIGHAYEKIATDVLAKYYKQKGVSTYFLTGADEHGIKIERTAKALGVTPKEHCDNTSDMFKKAWELLDIDYDRYIRTTDEDHKFVVTEIFKNLVAKGDIYKDSYTGLYCNGCESFLSPRELTEEGLCPNHNSKPQEVQEENYFFKLSKYKDRIIEHIKSNPTFILPEFRANEILNQLEDISDISVSRSKDSVSWGIPVPGDESQIIYVWIDALSNYITGAGYLKDEAKYNKLWPADCHMIGKDILKFHSIYWIALLMAIEVELPKTIFAHGWITIDEQKMGKSLGNVISPESIIKDFELENPDPFRYFMMTTAPFGKDGNYSDEDFKNKVNADLANNMGNLLNRTLSMLVKYFDGEVKDYAVTADNELSQACAQTKKSVVEYFEKYQITEAAESIIGLVDATNKYVNEMAPWSLAKDETKMELCAQVLYNVLETMRQVSVMMYPFTPNISQKIWEQLSREGKVSEQCYNSLFWGGLSVGKIADKKSVKPVFLRLDSELAGDKKKG